MNSKNIFYKDKTGLAIHIGDIAKSVWTLSTDHNNIFCVEGFGASKYVPTDRAVIKVIFIPTNVRSSVDPDYLSVIGLSSRERLARSSNS